ncbi:MAG: bi-domain-containing oxidoreductase [Sedimentisphaerales bacterium]|nr:bi-domain-containing oxidoreductase [Sedimentisphaerales bacterium]
MQNLRTGRMEIEELPCPQTSDGQVLIKTRASVISAGTERMLLDFGRANLITKARQQPEKVRQVIDKIKTDGFLPTLDAVFRKLDEPLPLGYCNSGVVLDIGQSVNDIQPGDRVISNGPHAEIVCVQQNLCVKIPDGVTFDQAAFTVLASIGLQSLRLASPTFGEKFMVFGVGLIGLLTIQLLKASGCEVLGIDYNSERLNLAESFGAKTVDLSKGTDPIASAKGWTNGNGADGAIITASAKNDEIIHQAAESCRKRGRIVLVGVVGLNLKRSDFYKKELTFQVSCSYGPGRYDQKYEQKGYDYPPGYVRWTEKRNFEAVLGAMASGSLNVEPLITHRYKLGNAPIAYDKIRNDRSALGIILEYEENIERNPCVIVTRRTSKPQNPVTVGVIGAGNFTIGTILPCLKLTDASLKYIAGKTNPSAVQHAAKKFDIENAITDYRRILDDKEVDTLFIITGHHVHARMVIEGLEADKHVFVEKPLAITEQQLNKIAETVSKHPAKHLMVGFNRRFSPHTAKIKQLLSGRTGPLCISLTVNAGQIPAEHWIQDPERGGGRIIGEGCHFIDLLSYIAANPVHAVSAMTVGDGPAVREDMMSMILYFADGSIGSINYFANGSKRYPKEILEIFNDGRILKTENFRVTRGYGFSGFRKFRTLRQDKGHKNEIKAFIDGIHTGSEPLIPFEQLANVTHSTFAAVESARKKQTIILGQQETSENSAKWPLLNLSHNFSQPYATCKAGK